MTRDRADTANEAKLPDRPQLLRLFIALETNAAMQAALVAAQQTLQRRGGSPLGTMPVRGVPPAQTHVTLQFLGNVMAAHVAALTVALSRAIMPRRAFLLRAGNVGAFPTNEAPRVLWLDVQGEVDRLMAVQRAVSRAVQQVE